MGATGTPELLGPSGGEGARLLHRDGSAREIEPGRRMEAQELAGIGGELEEEAHRRARPAQAAQGREAGRIAAGHRGEQRAPGKEDRQPIGQARQLAGRLAQRQAAEERVAAGAARGPAEVVRHRIDADDEDVRLGPGTLEDEQAVSGPEVDVDRAEAPRPLRESSAVCPAFLPSFDDDHGNRKDIARRPWRAPKVELAPLGDEGDGAGWRGYTRRMSARIAVVGDYDPKNATHLLTNAALGHVGLDFEWVATDAIREPTEASLEAFDGLWIAPASPYRSMSGALAAIRHARERGVPLVGT